MGIYQQGRALMGMDDMDRLLQTFGGEREKLGIPLNLVDLGVTQDYAAVRLLTNVSDEVRAETGAAIAIYTATALGVGISTTHTITGAIVGVGATRRLSAVRWGVAAQIVWAWILTIPASATIGALCYLVSRLFE